MNNPNNLGLNTYELPNLEAVRFSLMQANVAIVGGPSRMQHPRLTTRNGGGPHACTYQPTFDTDGHLTVLETRVGGDVGDKQPSTIATTGRGDSRGDRLSTTTTAAADSQPRNDAFISGYTPFDRNVGLVLLQIPEGHAATDLNIDTVLGNVEARGVEAGPLRISSVTGRIALYDTEVKGAALTTTTGNIRADRIRSAGSVTTTTATGNTIVDGGEASGGWTIRTTSGLVAVRGALGVVDASSALDRVLVE